MSRFDIICFKLILVFAGLVIVAVEVCLLAGELLTGISGSHPAWLRGLVLVAGLVIVVLALRVKRR